MAGRTSWPRRSTRMPRSTPSSQAPAGGGGGGMGGRATRAGGSRRCSQPNAVAGCLAGSLAGVKYGSISKGAPPPPGALDFATDARMRAAQARPAAPRLAPFSCSERRASPRRARGPRTAGRSPHAECALPSPPPTTRSLRLARSPLRCVRAAGRHRVPGRGGRRSLEWHAAWCCSIGLHSHCHTAARARLPDAAPPSLSGTLLFPPFAA